MMVQEVSVAGPELQCAWFHSDYCLLRVSCLTSQKHVSRWIGDTKLPLDVNEQVNVCGDRRPMQGTFSSHAQCIRDRLWLCCDPNQFLLKRNEFLRCITYETGHTMRFTPYTGAPSSHGTYIFGASCEEQSLQLALHCKNAHAQELLGTSVHQVAAKM